MATMVHKLDTPRWNDCKVRFAAPGEAVIFASRR